MLEMRKVNNRNTVYFSALATIIFIFGMKFAVAAGGKDLDEAPINIRDPYIQALHDLTYDQKPPRPVPDKDYGIDPRTGKFSHPKATPLTTDFPNFTGQLDYWDQKSYAENVHLLRFYPDLASPFHSWQNIVDFGDRRIMYVYGSNNLKIFDITDPRNAELIHRKGKNWTGNGPVDEVNAYAAGDKFGAASIQWNKDLGKYIMVQSFEVGRIGVMTDKMKEPDKVDKVHHWPALKGIKVLRDERPATR